MNDEREDVPCGCVLGAQIPHVCLSSARLQHVQGLSDSVRFVYLFMLPTGSTEDLRALTRIQKIREEPINWE